MVRILPKLFYDALIFYEGGCWKKVKIDLEEHEVVFNSHHNSFRVVECNKNVILLSLYKI